MDVVLIDLARRSPLFRTPLWMPLYGPSAAAVLRRAGHRVTLIERGRVDDQCRGDAQRVRQSVAEALRRAAPGLVLFDVQAENWPDLPPLAATARAAAPGALIMAGGRHPTLCPTETLEACPELDATLCGEPEEAVLQVAQGTPLAAVPALAVRHAGQCRPPAHGMPVADLDALPLPAWDLLDMAYHTRRTPRVIPCIPLRTLTLETSRGCGASCTFCAEGRLHARAHRRHSAAYVTDAIEKAIADYAVEGLYFSDENFLADRERVIEFCDAMMRQGLGTRVRWAAQVRTDAVDPDVLAGMARAGCVQLEFGIETGSQRMLDRLAKGTTVAQNAAAIRMARQAGIRSLAYIMIGMPAETRADIRATARFLAAADPDIVRLNRFIVFPGTPAANGLVSDGRLARDFWQRTRASRTGRSEAMPNVSGMTPRQFSPVLRRLYFRHVFPRYWKDYAKHNRPWAMPGQIHAGRFCARLLARALRPSTVVPT